MSDSQLASSVASRGVSASAAAPPHGASAARGPWNSGPAAGGTVHLRLDQLSHALRAAVPDIALDLLEVATYVYAADQSLPRGGTRTFDDGDRWRRDLHFEVPVRRPGVWNRPDVRAALTGSLGFLTDDRYHFRFHPGTGLSKRDAYLFDGADATPGGGFEEVVLFSGGIDSFAGAVDEVLGSQRRVALVSHRTVSTTFSRQRELVRALGDRLPRKGLAPLHAALTVNKGKELNRDFTQRSRSFLFAAAAAVACGLGLSNVRFYENGVTGLNLPISPQLTGAGRPGPPTRRPWPGSPTCSPSSSAAGSRSTTRTSGGPRPRCSGGWRRTA